MLIKCRRYHNNFQIQIKLMVSGCLCNHSCVLGAVILWEERWDSHRSGIKTKILKYAEVSGLALLHNSYRCTIVSSLSCGCILSATNTEQHGFRCWLHRPHEKNNSLVVSSALEVLQFVIPADRVSNKLRQRICSTGSDSWNWVKKKKVITARCTSPTGELCVWICRGDEPER